MAKLFRNSTTRYRVNGKDYLPDGTRVKKDTPGAVAEVVESAKWYGVVGGSKVALHESKTVSQRMLDKFRGDAALAGAGIVDPFAEHHRRPIGEHLEDFRRHLESREAGPQHVHDTITRVRAVLEGCGFESITDLDALAAQSFIAGRARNPQASKLPAGESFTAKEVADILGVAPASVRRLARRGLVRATGERGAFRIARADLSQHLEGRGTAGAKTRNHYIANMKQFSRWLLVDRRTDIDRLVSLRRGNAAVDRRHRRRAAGAEDLSRLIETAYTDTAEVCGLTGPQRAVLILLAVYTGLRASEIRSLTPSSFKFDEAAPTVTVAAKVSKHRREDVLPISPDVAATVRKHVAGRPDREPIWPGTWNKRAAEMLRHDLRRADIPYKDETGRILDFHGLRHCFITALAQARVHPKVAQTLARHSTITLTLDNYSHVDRAEAAKALEELPPIPRLGPPSQHAVNTYSDSNASSS